MDTRDVSTAPVVTAIRGRFFDDGKKAYFLPGLPVQERIEATVDWRGQAAGTVTFRTHFWKEDLDSVPKDDNGKNIPGCTGEALKWSVSIDLVGSIKSDGAISVTVSEQHEGDGGIPGIDYWNLLGHKVYPKYEFGLHGQYLGAQGWSYGGHGAIGLSCRGSTPPVYVWHVPPVYSKAYLSASIKAKGDITKHPARDDIQWNLSLPGEALVGLIGGVGVDGAAAVELFGGGGPYWDLQLVPDPSMEEYGITME